MWMVSRGEPKLSRVREWRYKRPMGSHAGQFLVFTRLCSEFSMGLFLLDYGAGNVQSLANSIERLGHSFQWISSAQDFDKATVSASLSPPAIAHAKCGNILPF